MRIQMDVTGLAVDSASNAPIVILKERQGERILPIWIGVVEASAIAFELESIKLARPMTHDLLKGAIEAMGGSLHEVAITELRDSTYFAVVAIQRDGQRIELDARPSDAIALALRAHAPVFCAAELLERTRLTASDLAAARVRATEQAASAGTAAGEAVVEEEALPGPRPLVLEEGPVPQDLLENLPPEDFGKYKM